MSSPMRNIFTIARFESKTLFRSWFFRIFALIGIILLITFNLILLLDDSSRWWIRAISSAVPYTNTIMYSIAQGIIASFLASEFLKRDKKLDTTEVIYIRSMSNGEYVIGKTLGIVYVFLTLNFLILFVAGIVNLMFEDVTFNLAAYFIYPLLISLPALIFILGIAYIFMLLLKNQAVTFLALLGLLAASLFYISDSYNYAFDFLAFSFPMILSDIIGFSDIGEVLIQRGYFLFIGLGFIFLSVLLLNRLEQSKTLRITSAVLTILFLVAGGSMFYSYLNKQFVEKERRVSMVNLVDKYIDQPNVTITANSIEVIHKGEKIEVISEATVVNNNAQALNKSMFTLNPGLVLVSVQSEGNALKFSREEQFIVIDATLNAGASETYTFTIAGTIDPASCYLDVDDEILEQNRRNGIYNVNKDYFFITDNFVLLTPEVQWYPSTYIAFSQNKSLMTAPDFTNFTLKVTTKKGLRPMSQGKRIEDGDSFLFESKQPLPRISLSIGNYVEKSIVVDSVKYSIVHLMGNNYYDKYFEDLGDTLKTVISELKNDYERSLMSNYPFDKFSIVEVPTQFISFSRRYTLAKEVSQPELVYMPEKGVGINWADFEYRTERIKQNNERRGGEMTDIEIQISLFKSFVSETITSSGRNNNLRFSMFQSKYPVFPNYYSYTNYTENRDWPYFNRLLEAYLFNQIADKSERQFWFFTGNQMDEAAMALQEKSFAEILKDSKIELYENVIKAKSEFVFTMLKSKLGEEEFNAVLQKTLYNGRFKAISFSEFTNSFDSLSGTSTKGIINDLVVKTDLPGYLASDISYKSFKDGDYTKYSVSVKISNVEQNDGVVILSYKFGGGRGGRGGFFRPDGGAESSVDQLIDLKAGETKLITRVLDSQVRELSLNTILAKNLPFQMTFTLDNPEEQKYPITDRITVVEVPVNMTQPGEIVVDNEDSGFKVSEGEGKTPLRALINSGADAEDEAKYKMIKWRAPLEWTPTLSSEFFGDMIKSGHYIKGGDGTSVASWETELKESGNYDVYVYLSKNRLNVSRGGRNAENNNEFQYFVTSDDGREEIVVELKSVVSGWNTLGTFYISEGVATVELTNKTESRNVFADAVKWVKR